MISASNASGHETTSRMHQAIKNISHLSMAGVLAIPELIVYKEKLDRLLFHYPIESGSRRSAERRLDYGA